MKHKKGTGFMCLGGLLIIVALGLMIYNIRSEKQAEDHVHDVLKVMAPEILQQESENEIYAANGQNPEYYLYPEMEMPGVLIAGERYIGMLSIPSIGLELPVIDQWSYEALNAAPCRYSGSVYMDNMVIVAHNYRAHFGSIKNLYAGEPIVFKDMNGNVFRYYVDYIEELKETAVEDMTSGEWSLTLFTCTLDGRSRVAVRCVRE